MGPDRPQSWSIARDSSEKRLAPLRIRSGGPNFGRCATGGGNTTSQNRGILYANARCAASCPVGNKTQVSCVSHDFREPGTFEKTTHENTTSAPLPSGFTVRANPIGN